jgi:hypothetical protein
MTDPMHEPTTTPFLEQASREYAGLRLLPGLADQLLALLRDPVETEWHGRNGYEHHCRYCSAERHWGRGVTHRASCPWDAAMKQAEALRASGVLLPKPAVKPAASATPEPDAAGERR